MKNSRVAPNCPDYWHVLSESDRKKYRELRLRIDLVSFRTIGAHSPLKLQIIITEIKHFAISHDGDDWRCLVCGIVWLPDAVAVSTRQMSLLVAKSKASINAGF
jgi:hypothetical protein